MLENTDNLCESPEMSDLLSNLLNMARTTSSAGGGLLAEPPWAVGFPKLEKIKYYGILRGKCWLTIDSAKKPIHVTEGDIILLSGLKSYVLSSGPNIKPVSARTLFPSEKRTFAQIGRKSSSDFEFIGGHTLLDEMSVKLLQNSLPRLVHIKSSLPQSPILMSLLKELVMEYKNNHLGAEVICNQLSHLLFLQILRISLEMPQTLPPGWLRAMSDRRLAPALRLIHDNPGESWTIAKLAKSSSMSRSVFMEVFKREASMPPLRYVTEWRMILARRILKDEPTTIKEIAFKLGYGSESTFSHTFKRLVGESPQAYRRSHEFSS